MVSAVCVSARFLNSGSKELSMSQANTVPEDHSSYVSVYKPVAGWKAIQMWWNTEEPGIPGGSREPLVTPAFPFPITQEAAHYAKSWAALDCLSYVPTLRDDSSHPSRY